MLKSNFLGHFFTERIELAQKKYKKFGVSLLNHLKDPKKKIRINPNP